MSATRHPIRSCRRDSGKHRHWKRHDAVRRGKQRDLVPGRYTGYSSRPSAHFLRSVRRTPRSSGSFDRDPAGSSPAIIQDQTGCVFDRQCTAALHPQGHLLKSGSSTIHANMTAYQLGPPRAYSLRGISYSEAICERRRRILEVPVHSAVEGKERRNQGGAGRGRTDQDASSETISADT